MDIPGIGSCDKHQEAVQLAYFILLSLGEKDYNQIITSLKRKEVLKMSEAMKCDNCGALKEGAPAAFLTLAETGEKKALCSDCLAKVTAQAPALAATPVQMPDPIPVDPAPEEVPQA